jgi:phage shock protein PspC (stress-responsive transcriptional regulator)
MQKKLYKTEGAAKKLCGVCGGVAEYFEIDPTLVRIGWVFLALCGSLGFWGYIICAIIMPKKSDLFPGL